MKIKTFLRIIFFLSVTTIFSFVGCGGGGGGGEPVTPPSDSLTGTYSLSGFYVLYSDGSWYDENNNPFSSWSGTMVIGSSTISQQFVFNSIPVGQSGSYTVTWYTPGVDGIATINGSDDIYFSISGNEIMTYSGVVPMGGLTFEEWDYWIKVSNAYAPSRTNISIQTEVQSLDKGFFWIGEINDPYTFSK